MTDFLERTLLEDLLANGVDDWVYEAQVCGNIARIVVDDAHDRRAVAIGLIQVAILRELVVAGRPGVDGSFEPWDVSPADAAAKVAVDWMGFPEPDVGPGEVVWLRNTESGDGLGRAVLARESA